MRRLDEETDFISYLRHLRELLPRTLVFIVANNTPWGEHFTAKHSQILRESLGLHADLCGKFRMAYIAVIERGVLLVEQMPGTREDFLRIMLKNNGGGVEYTVVSGGFETKTYRNTAIVEYGGRNLALNRRGLNFVVLDADSHELIDSCAVDTYIAEFICYREDYAAKFFGAYRRSHPDVTLIGMNLPAMPTVNNSANEMFFRENGGLRMGDFLANIDRLIKSGRFVLADFYSSVEEIKEVLDQPKSYTDAYGRRSFFDVRGNHVNIVGGMRVTHYQPAAPERAVYIIGPCHIFGVTASDETTIASFLQKRINGADKNIIVHNCGYYLMDNMVAPLVDEFKILNSLPIKAGDIAVIVTSNGRCGEPFCDLSTAAERPHDYGETFFCVDHYTPAGYHLIADKLFDYLEANDFFPHDGSSAPDLPVVGNTGHLDEDKLQALVAYKNKLKSLYATIKPIIGAAVMNCNPFTLGHRYLVEEALARCDRLIIFVVEEDKSVFSFADRFGLVRQGTADLPNVTVIGSGQFIISTSTFTEYFNKEKLQDVTIDPSLDLTIFAREIAPCMDISVRFVGEEPFDKVTRQYNDSMRTILRTYGIKVTELPRLEIDGVPISASRVRELSAAKDWAALKKLVPKTTFDYLREKYRT